MVRVNAGNYEGWSGGMELEAAKVALEQLQEAGLLEYLVSLTD